MARCSPPESKQASFQGSSLRPHGLFWSSCGAAGSSFTAPLAPVKWTKTGHCEAMARCSPPESKQASFQGSSHRPHGLFWSSCGAAGSRTPVQASSQYAFYTLSLLLLVGRTTGLRPAHALRIPLSFAAASGPCSNYSGFFDASDGSPPVRATRETAGGAKPLLRLPADKKCCQLLAAKLVVDGPHLQRPACLHTHFLAVKTGQPRPTAPGRSQSLMLQDQGNLIMERLWVSVQRHGKGTKSISPPGTRSFFSLTTHPVVATAAVLPYPLPEGVFILRVLWYMMSA